jgi:hypothetical protein
VQQAPGQVVEVTATYSEAYPHFRVCEVSLCARLLIGDRVNRITDAPQSRRPAKALRVAMLLGAPALERFDFE